MTYSKEYYQKNKERYKKLSRRWRKKNRAKCNALKVAWQKKNRDKVNEYKRKWYFKNKEKYLAYQKEYRETHPEFQARQNEKKRIYSKKYQQENPEKVKKAHHEWYMKNRKRLGYKGLFASPGTGWNFVRLKVLARDNCICQVCGGGAREVHHLDGTGSNRLEKEKNNSMDNLITVCHKCHIKLDVIQKGGKFGPGRGKWQEETKRNIEIVELSKKFSQTKISKMYGLTRQRISQIIDNWVKKEAGVL